MAKSYDAIIIGAGIIGCSIAYELTKKGYKTLNIDKLPAAGYGSTSNSCAIVRAHYSTFDGVAMAYEGFFYWKNWAEHLDAEDESGYAKYIDCGTILLKTEGHNFSKVQQQYDEIGVKYEDWDFRELSKKKCLSSRMMHTIRRNAPKMMLSGKMLQQKLRAQSSRRNRAM